MALPPDPQRKEIILACLARILATETFLKQPAAAQFLKFVVMETLEGRGDRLKAFTIATVAFNRPDSFDPQSDSFIRVLAMRLRDLMRRYYEGEGASDPVQIVLPTGGYTPEFRPPAKAPARRATKGTAAPVVAAPSPARNGRPWGWIAAGATLILALLLASLGNWRETPDALPAAPSPAPAPVVAAMKPPVIVMRATTAGVGTPLLATAWQRIFDGVTVGVNAFISPTVRVLDSDDADDPEAYLVVLRFNGLEEDAIDLTAQVLQRGTRAILWTRQFLGIQARNPNQLNEVIDAIIPAVADRYGVIGQDEMTLLEEVKGTPKGYACVVYTARYFQQRLPQQRPVAQSCLEQRIAEAPGDVRAIVYLASLLVDYYIELPDVSAKETLERAQQLAQRAIQQNTRSYGAQFVMYYTNLYARNFELAFAAAETALQLNRHSVFGTSMVGDGFILRGQYARGLELHHRVGSNAAGSGPFMGMTPLAHYMLGDDNRAEHTLDALRAYTPGVSYIVGAILCAKRNDIVCTARRMERLQSLSLHNTYEVERYLNRLALNDEAKARLMREWRLYVAR